MKNKTKIYVVFWWFFLLIHPVISFTQINGWNLQNSVLSGDRLLLLNGYTLLINDGSNFWYSNDFGNSFHLKSYVIGGFPMYSYQIRKTINDSLALIAGKNTISNKAIIASLNLNSFETQPIAVEIDTPNTLLPFFSYDNSLFAFSVNNLYMYDANDSQLKYLKAFTFYDFLIGSFNQMVSKNNHVKIIGSRIYYTKDPNKGKKEIQLFEFYENDNSLKPTFSFNSNPLCI